MYGRIIRTSPREAIAKEFGVTRFADVDWHRRYFDPGQRPDLEATVKS